MSSLLQGTSFAEQVRQPPCNSSLPPLLQVRSYRDLGNHLRCNEIIHRHEQQTVIRYNLLAHSRADIRFFTPLSPEISREWSSLAEAEAHSPHIYMPSAPPHDRQGTLDIIGVANRKGWAALMGVRDSVTEGLPPYNAKCDIHMTDEHAARRAERFGCGGITPELFTAAQLQRVGVSLTRGAWAFCRVDSLLACRYASEVSDFNRGQIIMRARSVLSCEREACSMALARGEVIGR